MKNIRSIASILIVLALIVSLFTFASAEEGKIVYFNMSLRKNLNMARYSVDVYLDGVKIVTIDQGGIFTGGVILSSGYHTLWFEPAAGSGYEYLGRTSTWILGNLGDGSVVSVRLKTHEVFRGIELIEPSVDNSMVPNGDHDYDTAQKAAGYIIKILF